jgi:hypothetical protein
MFNRSHEQFISVGANYIILPIVGKTAA